MARAQVSIDEALCHLEELEDPRSQINRKHPLLNVFVIAIMGVVAQATGPTGITTILARFLHHAEIIAITGRGYRHRNQKPPPTGSATTKICEIADPIAAEACHS
jgi:hypothetical protein